VARETALVLCDVEDEQHRPVEESPRRSSAARSRARGAGLPAPRRVRAEFVLFKDSYEGARRKHYRDLETFGWYAEDYHILQTSKEEFVHRDIRNGMLGAGIVVESSKGEWSPGQQEINLRYGEPLPCADDHVIYKNGAKEIAHQKASRSRSWRSGT
jgi:glutamine synthetase